MNGCIFIPAAELIKMIDPPRPPSMIFCAPAITVFHVPVTLTSITSRNDSGVISFHAWGAVMPALATMMSSRPRVATALLTTSHKPSKSRTSIAEAMIRRPAASTSRTVSARSSGVAESYRTQDGSLPAMSTAMMSAPSRAMRTACARPWPRAAPVMNATLPFNRPSRVPLIVAPQLGSAAAQLVSSLSRLDEVGSDDQALNLAGAFVEPQQPHVAVDAFDGNTVHVAAAAVHLHREIGYLAGHFGAEQLRRGRRDPAVGIGDPLPCGVADKGASGQHSGLLVGEDRLHQLKAADRRTALRSGGGVGHRFVERALGRTDSEGGDVDSAAGQRGHRRAVTDLVTAADQRAVFDPDIVKVDVGGPGALLPHLGVLGAHLDAVGIRGYQEDGDPGTLVIGRPGARAHHEQVGDGRVGDEALLAGYHPGCVFVGVVANGFRPQTGGVRSSAGLRQRERGHDVARGHRLQPSGLLLVGAEPDEYLSGDAVVGAEHRSQRQRGVAQFHCQLYILDEIESQAAPPLWNRVSEQPHLLGLLAQVVRHPVVGQDLLFARYHRGAHEVAGLGTDLFEILVGDLGDLSCGHLLDAPHRLSLLAAGTVPRHRARSYIKYDIRAEE